MDATSHAWQETRVPGVPSNLRGYRIPVGDHSPEWLLKVSKTLTCKNDILETLPSCVSRDSRFAGTTTSVAALRPL